MPNKTEHFLTDITEQSTRISDTEVNYQMIFYSSRKTGGNNFESTTRKTKCLQTDRSRCGTGNAGLPTCSKYVNCILHKYHLRLQIYLKFQQIKLSNNEK